MQLIVIPTFLRLTCNQSEQRESKAKYCIVGQPLSIIIRPQFMLNKTHSAFQNKTEVPIDSKAFSITKQNVENEPSMAKPSIESLRDNLLQCDGHKGIEIPEE